MNRLFGSILILLVSSTVSAGVILAADIPLNWPWHGMVVNSEQSEPGDVQFLKDYLRINHLSLHIKARFKAEVLQLSPEKAWDEELKWADSMLDACKKLNITATIATSNFPIDPQYGIRQDSPEFWLSEKHINDLLDRVDILARHYNNRGNELSAYEILAEPLLRDDKKVKIPDNWPKVRESIIKIIRKHDVDRWVAIAPGPGGEFSGYLELKKLDDPHIIYTAHVYQPHLFTHQGIQERPLGTSYPGRIGIKKLDKEFLRSVSQPLRDFQVKNNVPVWIGEFSAVRWADGAERYIKDAVDMFDEYGWSWSYFCYKSYHGWNPDYNKKYSGDNIEEWSKDYVGLSSSRWVTLRGIFGIDPSKIPRPPIEINTGK